MLKCPKCMKRINIDSFTGLYYCTSCGYQGSLVIQDDE